MPTIVKSATDLIHDVARCTCPNRRTALCGGLLPKYPHCQLSGVLVEAKGIPSRSLLPEVQGIMAQ